jgi:hypothetical protein
MEAPTLDSRPPVAVADAPKAPRLSKFEWVLAGVLAVNASMGATVFLGLGCWTPHTVWDLLALVLPVLGLAAAGTMWRWPVLGLFLGQLFYLPQCVYLTSPDATWGVRCGLNLSFYMQWAGGVTAGVNFLAIALLVAHFVVLNLRGRRGRAGRTRGCVN